MKELLNRLSGYTRLDNLRVRQFSGIVFFCGGPTTDEDCPPRSARDYFLKYIKKESPSLYKRIFLAEQVNAWASDMIREGYTPDLLTFESHVSGLATTVSLIVESPGSIAELGSFCLLTGIRERLMVVAREGWMTQDSFISLGPIAFLREISGDDRAPVHVYPWKIQYDEHSKKYLPDVDDLANQASNFLEDLAAFEDSLPKKPKWDAKNKGHLSLLISDLITTFDALRVQEVAEFLHSVGLRNIDRKTIKGHMFLLEKLNLVKKVSHRASDYYVSTADRFFVDLNLSGAPAELTDRTRLRFLVAQKIEADDRSRASAIRSGRS